MVSLTTASVSSGNVLEINSAIHASDLLHDSICGNA
jgi:hypothetical protein